MSFGFTGIVLNLQKNASYLKFPVDVLFNVLNLLHSNRLIFWNVQTGVNIAVKKNALMSLSIKYYYDCK